MSLYVKGFQNIKVCKAAFFVILCSESLLIGSPAFNPNLNFCSPAEVLYTVQIFSGSSVPTHLIWYLTHSLYTFVFYFFLYRQSCIAYEGL